VVSKVDAVDAMRSGRAIHMLPHPGAALIGVRASL
jgi:hypothetical protein